MSKLSEIEARAADWIAERDRLGDSDLWTDGRERELQQWVATSSAHRVAYLRLDNAWKRADRLQGLRQPAGHARLGTASSPGRIPVIARWSHAARVAFAVLMTSALGLLMVRSDLPDPAVNYATELGQRRVVALADGTRITLNTSTHLRTVVSASQRNVWMDSGEGFFEVAHDAARPFIVHVRHQQIVVVGTRFALRLEGESLRVGVVEGRVRIEPEQGPAVTLSRNQIGLSTGERTARVEESNEQVVADLGWLHGKIVFNGTTLADAVHQFNRYNKKKLRLDDDATARITIGGTFDADNVEAFARLLQTGFGLKVRDLGTEIRVSNA